MTTSALLVVAVNQQNQYPVDEPRWSALAQQAFQAQGVLAGECNLLFVEPTVIAELNEAHRGKATPTDVLSFALDGPDAASAEDLIGDIVICPEVAAANAGNHAGPDGHQGTLDDELALLVVHGVLHLLGFDHVDDAEAEVMEAREQELLAAYHR